MLSARKLKQNRFSSTSPSPQKIINNVKSKDVKYQKMKVFVRFKPLTQKQKERYKKQIEFCNQTELTISAQNSQRKVYCFDYVFHEKTPNIEVFNKVCQQLMKGLVKGQNGLVFVYGNTGTGKTYTMGLLQKLKHNSEGIIPEALKYIFNNHSNCHLSISFCQIYMEEIYDLLSPQEKKLTIRETPIHKQPYIQNLLKIKVNNTEQAFKLINIGLQQRHIAEQKLNRNSSRSHAIITFYLKNYDNGKEVVNKLCFIDLAGSQRIKQTESKGVNLSEALHINSSLSALETLLINLSTNSLPSYRANKLTRLVQPYFQNGKMSLIVTHNTQNVQPIQFAKRCKGIKFIQKKYQDPNEVCAFNKKVTKQRIQFLQKELKKAKDKSPDKSMTQQTSTKSTQSQYNQKLLYYINCLVALLSKINKYIDDMVQINEAEQPQTFSLKELIGINENKSEFIQIEQKINRYLNQLSQNEKMLRIDKINVPNPQKIIQSINDNNLFISQIQSLGKSIITNTRYIHQIGEFRKGLKNQLITSQLKCNLLERKGKREQQVIQYLINKIDKEKLKETIQKVKQMGIHIELKTDKIINKVINEEKINKNPHQKYDSPLKSNGFIYIDQEHSNL